MVSLCLGLCIPISISFSRTQHKLTFSPPSPPRPHRYDEIAVDKEFGDVSSKAEHMAKDLDTPRPKAKKAGFFG